MKNAIFRTNEVIEHLNDAERCVADYVLQHPREVAQYSVQKLADMAFASPSAVVRMCQAMGFSGYRDFKKNLMIQTAVEDASYALLDQEIKKNDSMSDIIKKVTYKNVQSLTETEAMLDPENLEKCVKLMQNADRILLYGLGASMIAAMDFTLKLVRINKNCIFNQDWHLQLISARNSTKKDVAIIFSYSGNTSEIIACGRELKKNHTPIIAVTRAVKTPISQMAGVILYTTANESLFRTAAMSSRISSLNIVDVLYTAFANSEYERSLEQLKKTHILKDKNHK